MIKYVYYIRIRGVGIHENTSLGIDDNLETKLEEASRYIDDLGMMDDEKTPRRK